MHITCATGRLDSSRALLRAALAASIPALTSWAVSVCAKQGPHFPLRAAPKVKLPAVKAAAAGGKAAQPAAPPAANGPRVIPGLTGPIAAINTREQLRAAKAKLQAEVRAPPGRNQPVAGADPGGFKGGVANMQATMAAAVARKAKAEWDGSGGLGEDAWAPPETNATLWDAIAVKANSHGKPQAVGERRSCQASTGVLRKTLVVLPCGLSEWMLLMSTHHVQPPIPVCRALLPCRPVSWPCLLVPVTGFYCLIPA